MKLEVLTLSQSKSAKLSGKGFPETLSEWVKLKVMNNNNDYSESLEFLQEVKSITVLETIMSNIFNNANQEVAHFITLFVDEYHIV